ARLTWQDPTGVPREETWEAWDPWAPLVQTFEAALAGAPAPSPGADAPRPAAGGAGTRFEGRSTAISPGRLAAARPRAAPPPPSPTWQDETRLLELDDTARRSVERRRANTLEYPEATEEVGFKGTMTLVGCSVLWGSLVLLILSHWVPWLGWLVVPLLVPFLALQLLRWVVK